MSEPLRLKDDLDEPEGLRELFGSAPPIPPMPPGVRAEGGRVAARLAAGGTLALGVGWGTLAAALGGIGVVAAVAVALLPAEVVAPAAEPPAVEPVRAPAPSSHTGEDPREQTPAPIADPVELPYVQSEPEPTRPGRTTRRAGRAAAEPAAREGDTLRAEVALLRPAHDALEETPDRALELTREHARRFPEGILAHEREVLAAQALAALGRVSEADTRAQGALRESPESLYSEPLEDVHAARVEGAPTNSEVEPTSPAWTGERTEDR